MEALTSDGGNNDKWIVVDDGTGRNAAFLNQTTGKKTRVEPSRYDIPYFDNGERRYFYRGHCIRCRQRFSPFMLNLERGSKAIAFNFCERCLLTTSGVLQIKGNHAKIYEANIDSPKILYADLKAAYEDPMADKLLLERAKYAKLGYLAQDKVRRDLNRADKCSRMAEVYGVKTGAYRSWGYGSNFDEYFGGLNNQNQPHGHGAKFYSDGTVYVGGWDRGQQKTDTVGLWTRPDGSQYEGQWLAGKKHGDGKQRYPDRSQYVGQFANGFEHGEGKKTYPNGAIFEGRFRFGRRDGPGTMTNIDGSTEKGVFRDAIIVPEKAPPAVYDADVVDEGRVIYQPASLKSMCVDLLAKRMMTHKHIITPSLLQRRLADHLKPDVGSNYLKMVPLVTDRFRKVASQLCFRDIQSVTLSDIKIQLEEIELFIYLSEANKILESIKFHGNKLQSNSIESLGRCLNSGTWRNLMKLEMCFNPLDLRGALVLMEGVTSIRSIRIVRLVGCRMIPGCGLVIGSIMQKDDHIEELDLSFNMIGAAGAEGIAEAIKVNKTMKILNVRMNDIQATGGHAIVTAMLRNDVLRQVCLVDNNVGDDVMSVLAARLNGTMTDLVISVRADQIALPRYFEPSRYSWKNH
jgi:hypothetical protein